MKISWQARTCFRPILQELSRCVQLLATAYREKDVKLDQREESAQNI